MKSESAGVDSGECCDGVHRRRFRVECRSVHNGISAVVLYPCDRIEPTFEGHPGRNNDLIVDSINAIGQPHYAAVRPRKSQTIGKVGRIGLRTGSTR